MNELEKKIASKKAVVGVIGMGYIGLSLLEAFGEAGFPLAGFDLDKEKIEMLKRKKSYLNFMNLKILFDLMDKHLFRISADPSSLRDCDVLVICVPTSLDRNNTLNLARLRAAFKTVLTVVRKEQLIVLQSSVYPGTTEEELLPLLEESNFKVGKDIFISYVPEVADIGNPNFSFVQVPRIISGVTPACRKMAELLYEQLGCKLVTASSTRVAESAKLLQNAFRLVNISLINELKIMFDRMGIDVWEVIEAAKSKPFGFMPFEPGPGVGGDCIPVTPLYLVGKARETDGPTTLIELADHVNDCIPNYVFNKIVHVLGQRGIDIHKAKVLVLGVAYKKNVNDLRESPALKLLHLLKEKGTEVDYHDPYVPVISHNTEFPDLHMKSIDLDYDNLSYYDVVVIVTDHSFYDWTKIVHHSLLIIDTRNALAEIKEGKGKIIKA
jgi:UDP-N-acetyl-D-glucosamine dehydrogenase